MKSPPVPDLHYLVSRKFITNSSYQLLSSVVTTAAGFGQAIILGRYLGVYNYGVFALLMTYAQFINQFVSCNILEFVIKYGTDYSVNNENDKYLATVKVGYMVDAISGIAALLVMVIAAKPVSMYIFHSPTIAAYTSLYSCILLCSFIDSTSNGVLRIEGMFGFISLRDSIGAVSRLFFIWIMLLLGYGINGVIVALLVLSFIQMIVNMRTAFKQLGCSPIRLLLCSTVGLLEGHRKEMKVFIAHNYLTQCWAMVIANIDMIILGYYTAPSQVGLYRMAKNFVNILARVVEPFYTVIYPDLVKGWAEARYGNCLSLIKNGTAAVSVLVTPLAVLLVLGMPFVLKFAVGESFLGAVEPARVLILGAWFAALFFWARPALLAMGKARTPTVVNFVNMVIYLVASLIIIPQYGIIGAASTYCSLMIFGNIVIVYFVFRHAFASLL